MKTLRLTLIIGVCVASALVVMRSSSGGDSVALRHLHINGASVYVVKADLNDPRIRIDIGLPERGIPDSETFYDMVSRRAPLAAVTGTYFDVRTLFPVGTIVVNGRIEHQNFIGTAVCFARSGEEPYGYGVRFQDGIAGEVCDWTGTQCGLRAGPRILAGGQYAFNPKREGFRYSGLFGARTRIALGVTKHNKLLLVSVRTPVTFGQLGTIMKRLGAVDAVNLDGGTSSAMYYRGRFVCTPGRALTNVIEIHRLPYYARAPKDVAKAPIPMNEPVGDAGFAWARHQHPAPDAQALGSGYSSERGNLVFHRQFAVMAAPVDLRGAKGLRALFPVDRAEFSRLKRLKDPQHLVHVSPDVKVVHDFVA